MRRVYLMNATMSPPGSDGDGVVQRVDESFLDELDQADAPGWRRMSLPSKLAYIALAFGRVAWAEHLAGISNELGVVIGSRFGCLSLFEEFHRVLRDEGPRAVSPTVFTTGVLNAPVGHASLGQGLRGPCHTLVGGEAAGLEAIALAWELLQAESLRYCFAIGVEEAPPILIEALRAGSALSSARPVTEGAAAILLGTESPVPTPTIGAVATGRCGRGHDAARRHAVLLRQAAAGTKPEFVDLPGLPGADGDREREAARIAFGEDVQITDHTQLGYAPGLVSAWVGGKPLGYAFQRPVIATAAGGHGTTVAIRFDPAS